MYATSGHKLVDETIVMLLTWQAIPSSATVSVLLTVTGTMIYSQSSFWVPPLWLLEWPGCNDATPAHGQGSHIIMAEPWPKCALRCGSIYRNIDRQEGAFLFWVSSVIKILPISCFFFFKFNSTLKLISHSMACSHLRLFGSTVKSAR